MNTKELMVKQVDVNGMIYPIGIDDKKPIFHYVVESEEKEKSISAYQVKVTKHKDVVWDTGKTKTDGIPYIVYSGEELEAKTCYQVQIKVWDESDNESDYSEPIGFETGFLGCEWNAHWIEPVQEQALEEKELSFMEMLIPSPEFWGGEGRLRECQQLRRSFVMEQNVVKARAYASAHGVYQLFVNGQEVSKRRLAPEISQYENLLYYQTYDVTKLLQSGNNVVSVLLADGWWIGRLGMAGDSCNYGNTIGFIMQMELEYEDGRVEVLCSDENFKCKGSYIRYSDLFIGEKHDLSIREDDWNQVTYEDTNWVSCQVIQASKEILTAQTLDPVVVTRELEPIKSFRTPKKEFVLDFGQVMAGVGRFEIEASAGTVITFEHGEVLDKNGNYMNNILGRNKDQKDVLICREGRQVFEPKFTYHGFRYIKITGIDEKQLISAKALVIGSPIPKTGSFSCSDERLNRLQHSIEWSTISNMISIPTDCPQREKLGWTGDIQIFAKTGCFNYDLHNFLRSWLKNLRAAQNDQGEVPVVVPNATKQERTQRKMSGDNSSAAWGDACILVPYYLYLSYGDKTILRENFDSMEKWLGFIKEVAARKPEGYDKFTKEQKERQPYLWTKQYHFGDWLIPSLRALPDGVPRGTKETAAVVGSSFYAISVSYFIKVCEALEEKKKAEEYRQLLEIIKKAVCEEFITEDGTVNNSSLQGLYVMILKAQVVDGDLKKKVLSKLVNLIKDNGYCLDTGFASVSYLLDVLYENGEAETAYKLLFQTKAPSWFYMVKKGATTIWENWMAILEDGTPTDSSYNHYAFGCVGEWIYRHIGGIEIAEPGYRKIIFQPDFNCGLSESDCEIMSPYGKVSLHWEKVGDNYKLRGCVPVGCTASLIAGKIKDELKAGTFELMV